MTVPARNNDVGFVKIGQHAEVKVETFPFTRYGTPPGKMSFVSDDAAPDEKRGLLFQAHVKPERATFASTTRCFAHSTHGSDRRDLHRPPPRHRFLPRSNPQGCERGI